MADLVKFFRVNEENGYMSNWWISEFTLSNMIFNCVEQYMMWRKAMLFGDIQVANKILMDKNPANMKKYGRQVENYVDSEWNAIREQVVYEGCLAKFTQNKDLKDKLLSYDEGTVFVECSPYDAIWGIKLSASDSDSDIVSKWRGQNLLGKCIGNVHKWLLTED